MSEQNSGIVTKPGRSGASAGPYGEISMPDPLVNEQGYRLLKYDSWGNPVYVPPKEYRELAGEKKKRCKRKPKGFGKGKKR